MSPDRAIGRNRHDILVRLRLSRHVQLTGRRDAPIRERQLVRVFDVLTTDRDLDLRPDLGPIGIVVSNRGAGKPTD